jgi:hypothetical protein
MRMDCDPRRARGRASPCPGIRSPSNNRALPFVRPKAFVDTLPIDLSLAAATGGDQRRPAGAGSSHPAGTCPRGGYYPTHRVRKQHNFTTVRAGNRPEGFCDDGHARNEARPALTGSHPVWQTKNPPGLLVNPFAALNPRPIPSLGTATRGRPGSLPARDFPAPPPWLRRGPVV